jgi:hypothetical protein
LLEGGALTTLKFTSGRGGGCHATGVRLPWSGGLCPWLAAPLVIGLLLAPALSLAVEPAFSSGPPSAVRLGERSVTATEGTVEVPVVVRDASGVDGLELMIDHEGEYLEYAQSRTVHGDWSIERITQYENRRLIIGLRKDIGARDPGGEAAVLAIVFKVVYNVPGAAPFRIDTALSLGTQSDPPNTASTHFFRIEKGTRRPVPTLLDAGSVSIYYGDGLEIGWGDITLAAQEFVLPLYLTYLEDDRNVFGVGIDYDELFLRVRKVRGLSPPLASEDIEHAAGEGRVSFELSLDNGLVGPFARLHVADLHIQYTGESPA